MKIVHEWLTDGRLEDLDVNGSSGEARRRLDRHPQDRHAVADEQEIRVVFGDGCSQQKNQKLFLEHSIFPTAKSWFGTRPGNVPSVGPGVGP